jgi:hemoglobin
MLIEGGQGMCSGRFVPWILTACLIVMTGCPASEKAPSSSASASLYERLGGKDAIQAVVDDFMARIENDSRINGPFQLYDLKRMKREIVIMLCAASGGPCVYTGRDMHTAHAGMQLKDSDVNVIKEDLETSMKKFRVGKKEVDEVLGLMESFRKDVVEIQTPPQKS